MRGLGDGPGDRAEILYRGSTSGLPLIAAALPPGNQHSGSPSMRPSGLADHTPEGEDMLRTAASVIISQSASGYGGMAELNEQLGLDEPIPAWVERKLLEI